MRLLRTVFAGILLLSASLAHSQTADEVISSHLNAIGGKALIASIKSQITNSTLSVMGSDLESTSTLLVGKGFKNVANFNGQEIIQSITPTGGWMINPLAGATDPQPLPEDQVKAAQPALYPMDNIINYKENGDKVELTGQESVEGVNTYKIKMTNKDGKETLYYFDAKTYYLVKRESHSNVQGQDMVATALFSNHKKTDFGLVIPYTTVSNQGFEMTINVTNVKFNVEVDPKVFEMPK